MASGEEISVKLVLDPGSFYADLAKANAAIGGLGDAFGSAGKDAAKGLSGIDEPLERAGQKATASGLKFDEAAGKWRNASGQFASAAEQAAAGVVKASDKVGNEGGKGFKSLEEIATGALRKVGEMAMEFAAEAGQAVVQFAVDGVRAAGDFEAGMNRFASVVGSSLDESGQSLESFKQLFLEMGAQTQFSAAQAQDAAIQLAKGGLDPATIAAGGLKAALDLAAAGEIDLAQAAEISAKQYGVWVNSAASAGEKAAFLAESANLLAQAANASTVDVDDLALGMANAGGVAKLAGASFRETVTAMALLAPGFSSAADAGTSFKTFLSALQPKTDAQAEAMARLNLLTEDGTSKFYDATGSFIGMENAAELLKVATEGLSEADKEKNLQLIFGQDAIRAAAALAEAGAEGYQEMAKQMAAAGTAAQQAAKRNQGFNFALESAKGSLETFSIVAGSLALPALTSLLNDAIIPLLNGATNLAGHLGDPTTQLGHMAQVAGSLVVPAIEGLAAATLAYAIIQLPVMITAVQTSVTAFMAQATAIAAIMLPLAAIAVAVGAVAWAWQDYQNKVTTATQSLLESREWWNASTEALQQYNAAQLSTNPNIAATAATVEQLRMQIEQEVSSLGQRLAQGQITDAQYQTEMATVNAKADALRVATGALNSQIEAENQAAVSSMTATNAAATLQSGTLAMGQQASLTADDLKKLSDQITSTFEQGAQAVGQFVDTEIGFIDQMTAENAEGHAQMTTDQAAAYAEQASAQKAHLGEMLTNYTLTQVQMGNITAETGQKIIKEVEESFGKTKDRSAETFLQMASDIDKAASEGGSSLDDLSGSLTDTMDTAVETRLEMEALAKEYEAELVQNFNEGKIDADAFRDALSEIPARVDIEVHTTYTSEGSPPDGAGGGGGSSSGGARAMGGPVQANTPYLVGERGPELFMPGQSGMIVPNDVTNDLMAQIAGVVRPAAPAISRSGQSISSTTNNFNYAPMYAAAPRAPSQDFKAMRALSVAR